MTKQEKWDFLKGCGWEPRTDRGFWWTKEGKNLRIDAALIECYAAYSPEPEPELVTLSKEVFDAAYEALKSQTPPMPDSVKESLENPVQELAMDSAYPHVGAGYARDMIDAIDHARQETVTKYAPRTYDELVEREVSLHAYAK